MASSLETSTNSTSADADIPINMQSANSNAENEYRGKLSMNDKHSNSTSAQPIYFPDPHGPWTNLPTAPTIHGPEIIQKMLGFAQREIDAGLLSCADWNRIFGFTGAVPEDDNHLRTLPSSIDPAKASNRLYGGIVPQAEPWGSQFKEIKTWLLCENSVTTTLGRRSLLERIQRERVYQIRWRFYNGGSIPDSNRIHMLLTENANLRNLTATLSSTSTKDDLSFRKSLLNDVMTRSFANPMGQPLVTDSELESAQRDGEDLVDEYRKRGSYVNEYLLLMQLARLAAQRNQRLKSISISEALEYHERAEQIFNDVKRQQILFREGFPMEMKTELAKGIDHHDLYDWALHWSLIYYNQASNQPAPAHATEQDQRELLQLRMRRIEDFLIWTHRSKARSLLETYGLRNRIPASLLATLEAVPESGKKLSDEQHLVQEIVADTGENKYRLQKSLLQKRDELRADPITRPIMDIRDGSIPSMARIREMVNQFGPDTVIVDYVHIAQQESWQQKMAIKMIVYRKNIIHDRIVIRGINMEDVAAWVDRNVTGKINNTASLVSEPESLQQLEMLATLVEPLARSETRDGWVGLKAGETLTKPGDTIVFCPTKFLHQIPLHALPLKGSPLIQRNPVVYCQSLPTLLSHYELYQDRKMSDKTEAKSTIIHSLLDKEDSTGPVRGIANSLGSVLKQGVDLRESEVLDEIDGSSILYYHGHVEFDEKDAMNSELALDFDRAKDPIQDVHANNVSRRITARKIWDTNLQTPPYHVHIIGCRSGGTQNLGGDDLLGFTTAFQFAGANSVVSTLWKIRDLDGSNFSVAFFNNLREQKARHKVPLANDAELDLALALQTAVNVLRTRSNAEPGITYSAAYHWAPFIMHGYWKIPAWCIEFKEE